MTLPAYLEVVHVPTVYSKECRHAAILSQLSSSCCCTACCPSGRSKQVKTAKKFANKALLIRKLRTTAAQAIFIFFDVVGPGVAWRQCRCYR